MPGQVRPGLLLSGYNYCLRRENAPAASEPRPSRPSSGSGEAVCGSLLLATSVPCLSLALACALWSAAGAAADWSAAGAAADWSAGAAAPVVTLAVLVC